MIAPRALRQGVRGAMTRIANDTRSPAIEGEMRPNYESNYIPSWSVRSEAREASKTGRLRKTRENTWESSPTAGAGAAASSVECR